MHLCYMSVSEPLVHLLLMEQPLSKLYFFFEKGFMCVLKDIVDVKLLWIKIDTVY